MSLDFRTLVFEQPLPNVGVLRFARPEVANAINTEMARELLAFFREIADADDIRCVILTGAGDKAFCAGGDLKQRNGMSDELWLAQHAIIEQGIVALIECPIPVIAAVNGAAYGGGCEWALAADFAYAADTAQFALPETRLGIIPGAGGTQTLPRAVGTRRAMEIICMASPFSAQEALAWGAVNRVFPPKQLMPEALAAAERIARNAPLAVRQAKKSIRVGSQLDVRRGLEFAIEAYNRLVGTGDRREGVRAFNEKRQPIFKGQ
jgi:enoyl-CoA hydratase/carnithine racemase